MDTIFVLMLLWHSPGGPHRTPAPEHVEFTSESKCNAALAYWASVRVTTATLVAGRCFPK